jgi:hypothetical protein
MVDNCIDGGTLPVAASFASLHFSSIAIHVMDPGCAAARFASPRFAAMHFITSYSTRGMCCHEAQETGFTLLVRVMHNSVVASESLSSESVRLNKGPSRMGG